MLLAIEKKIDFHKSTVITLNNIKFISFNHLLGYTKQLKNNIDIESATLFVQINQLRRQSWLILHKINMMPF